MSRMPKMTISVPHEGGAGLTGTWRTFRPIVNRDICNQIDGHRVKHVGIDPLDHTVAAGRDHKYGVFACSLEDISECK